MSLKHYENLEVFRVADDCNILIGIETKTKSKVFLHEHVDCFNHRIAAIRAIREIVLLNHCDHLNIIKLLNVFEVSESVRKLYTVYAYENYSLKYFNHASNRRVWCDSNGLLRIQNIVHGILEGVNYLHYNGIIHRNLNMENILINDVCEAKITNLKNAQATSNDTNFSVDHYNYAAPELFTPYYTETVDVWSVGCIFMELLTGEALVQPLIKNENTAIMLICGLTPLYKNDKAFQKEFEKLPVATRLLCFNIPEKNLRKKYPLEVLPQSSTDNVIGLTRENAMVLAEALLKFDPQQRRTASDALKFTFFISIPSLGVVNDTRIVDIPECNAVFQHLMEKPSDDTVHEKILDAAIQRYGETN